MNARIYHNPRCGTSRVALGLMRHCGVEPQIVEYLETPPSRTELEELLARAGKEARDWLRAKEPAASARGLTGPGVSNAAILDAMMEEPILIDRPIVVTDRGVALCRPSEKVLDLLPTPPKGEFRKENGDLILDADGQAAL